LKILAVGDFHGKIPRNLKKFVKNIDIDLILCTGDICSGNEIEWRYWNRLLSGEKLVDIVGKGRIRKIIKERIKVSDNNLKKLNQINLPVLMVYGNHDIINEEIKEYGMKIKGLEHIVKKYKNIMLLKNRRIVFNNLVILGQSGYRGYSEKKKSSKKMKNKLKKLAKYAKGDFILLTHDVPFGKLDKIRNMESPLNGEHIGDELYLDFDKKYQPMFHVCGHMHENQGKARIGRTIIVNPGFGRVGEAAIITLPERKVKFINITTSK
jgi:Icc-related predicted phosphoesterase